MSNTWKVTDNTLPLVACVMLCSPGRQKYQNTAIRCFLAQTYGNLVLVEMDAVPGVSIGEMRNRINAKAGELGAEIIAHWDDDDWHDPARIERQMTWLTGIDGHTRTRPLYTLAQVVGSNRMLFWREDPGEAWVYRNDNPDYVVGTSMMYWMSAWQGKHFADVQHGEDTEFLPGLKVCAGTTSGGGLHVARIHGGNSSSAYDPIQMWAHNNLSEVERNWQRVPEWDEYCRQRMAI